MYTTFHRARLLVGVLVLFVLVPGVPVHAGLLRGAEQQAKVDARAAAKRTTEGPWLLTYYVGYQNGYLKPRDVDYSLMTHIVVGGVGVNPDGTLDEHWHMKNGDGHDMAVDVGKRAAKAGVKTLIWLGGPNEQYDYLSATSDANRKKFVKNVVDLVHELKYDGVDINWEPIRAEDEPNLLAFVRDLRAEDPDLLITVPVNWVVSTLITKKDRTYYAELATYADRLFIMSYSMSGPWPGWKTWHSGALAGDTISTPSSLRTSAYAYTRAGVPKEKLGVGVGTYATCFEYPVAKPGRAYPTGFAPGDVGVMSMRTMMDEYYSKRYEKWDASAKVPYLSFTRARGDWDCGMISYENADSMAAKAAYVEDAGLGGLMVWNIGTGYYPDASRSKRHPLLKAAWEGLR